MPREFLSPIYSKVLEVGESSVPRAGLGAGSVLLSGVTYLSYFKAEKSEVVNNLVLRTNIGATSPTLQRFGIYTLDWTRVPTGDFVFYFGLEPGDLHQVAATANSTSILTASSAKYTVPLTTSWYKERGVDYALASIFVGSSGFSLVGQGTLNSTIIGDILGTYPLIAESITSQADLYGKYTRAARNPNNLSNVNAIGNTTSGSNVVTLTAAAGDGTSLSFFRADDVGQPISGAGIPAGTYILSWGSFTSVVLSANATSTNANIVLTIGPSPFSPTTQPRIPYVEFLP